MENKDVEKKLRESADKIEVRDFSEVWEQIKDRVDGTPARKKRTRRWLPAVASAVCGVAICAVVLPFALRNTGDKPVVDDSSSSAPTYLQDDLSFVPATLEEFTTGLEVAEISCFNFSKYVVVTSALLTTELGEVKGGELEITDAIENSTIHLNIQLYDESVEITDYKDVVYDNIYSVDNTLFEYRLKNSIPQASIYVYEIKTEYAGTQYYIKCTCQTEDLTSFFNGLFGRVKTNN